MHYVSRCTEWVRGQEYTLHSKVSCLSCLLRAKSAASLQAELPAQNHRQCLNWLRQLVATSGFVTVVLLWSDACAVLVGCVRDLFHELPMKILLQKIVLLLGHDVGWHFQSQHTSVTCPFLSSESLHETLSPKKMAVWRLQVDNSGCPDPNMQVTLGIGHLKSYEHMGQALVSCISGCVCEPTVFDGHNPASFASQEFWAYVAVTQSPQCVFEVASLSLTKSGQNKVKVTSLLLTCMSPKDALEVPIFQPKADKAEVVESAMQTF